MSVLCAVSLWTRMLTFVDLVAQYLCTGPAKSKHSAKHSRLHLTFKRRELQVPHWRTLFDANCLVLMASSTRRMLSTNTK